VPVGGAAASAGPEGASGPESHDGRHHVPGLQEMGRHTRGPDAFGLPLVRPLVSTGKTQAHDDTPATIETH
jgi:hypothetical protein